MRLVATVKTHRSATERGRRKHGSGLAVTGENTLLLAHQMRSRLDVRLQRLNATEGFLAKGAAEDRGTALLIFSLGVGMTELCLRQRLFSFHTKPHIVEMILRFIVLAHKLNIVKANVAS